MRRESLILGIVLVVLVLVFYVYNSYSEGFESIADKVQDRTNFLAGQQNPLKNPAANLGISETQGAALRAMSETALNTQNAVADGAGSYKQVLPKHLVSPRIDNENSYLGLIKMCKDKGVGDSPFSDSSFASNCGMCITSGTLKTGESFDGPTGVLVYDADKADAITAQAQNNYSFPRAIPSVDSATCVGANKDNNSLPVLALNQTDYDAFRKRKACRESHKIGEECGRCVSDQESTWVSPSGGIQSFTLYLRGAGQAKVSLDNGFVTELLPLSKSTTVVPIGPVKEGTKITINVLKGATIDGPYVYGALISPTVAKGLYKLPIDKFMERDSVSGAEPRKNGVEFIDDAKVFCTKLMTQIDKTSMNLTGFIPVTMVDSGQLASFDCPSAPIVQSQASAEFLIDDVCLKPKGQGPGKYSKECIQQTILQGGCSTNGSWYKDTPFHGSYTLSDLLSYMKYYSKISDKNPSISMGCKGIDISTPCDRFLYGGIPDQKCMEYLYFNRSENNKRVGRAYKNADTKYASINASRGTSNIGFCRDSGSLNPVGWKNSDNAMATLTGVAGGYNGISGIEAVKTYLSDVFMKAVSNLDVNIDDDNGGRKTSWEKCFGIKIADAPIRNVTKNAIHDVIDKRNVCFPFPQNIDIGKSRGKLIGQVTLTQDYSLSFSITPRGIQHEWSNIIHFTTSNDDWSPGSRSPAIWFHPGELKLHIRIGDSTDLNWGIDTDSLPINQKSSFSLECTGNKVTVMVNSKVYTATQPTYRASGNAIVYASNPWYVSANASIESLCYSGGVSPAHTSPNYACVKGWDHGGDDINCFGSKTIQELETMCNNNPNCKSFNTLGKGGCIKNQSSGDIRNINSVVTNFCVKNT